MQEDIINIIKGFLKDDSVEINEKSSILFDLGLNSYDLVQAVCAIEDNFDIEISDSDIYRFRTIGDIVKCIENKQIQYI